MSKEKKLLKEIDAGNVRCISCGELFTKKELDNIGYTKDMSIITHFLCPLFSNIDTTKKDELKIKVTPFRVTIGSPDKDMEIVDD